MAQKRTDIKDEEIIRLYVEEKLIGREIAEKLRCSIPLIQQRLKQAGIKMRPSNDRKTFEIPPKEELNSLYWEKELHPSQIGKIYKVSFSTAVNWMKDYGITFRTKSEARIGKMNPIYGVGHSEQTKEKMSLMFLDGRRKVVLSNQYGKATPYKGITYRSRWEAAVAYYLDSQRVEYIYERDSFTYLDGQRRRVYTPDFYLPNGLDNQSDSEYLEVKGRFKDRDLYKINKVRENGPVIHLWDMEKLIDLDVIDTSGKVVIGDFIK